MSKENSNPALESSLRLVWRRTQERHISAGFLAIAHWGTPLFLAGMTLDWFAYLPTNGRILVLLIIVSASLFQAWRKGWRFLRTFDPTLTALEIEGTFDDCQKLVKQAFLDKELCQARTLTSANSINIARLIPQAFYYFYAISSQCYY